MRVSGRKEMENSLVSTSPGPGSPGKPHGRGLSTRGHERVTRACCYALQKRARSGV